MSYLDLIIPTNYKSFQELIYYKKKSGGGGAQSGLQSQRSKF